MAVSQKQVKQLQNGYGPQPLNTAPETATQPELQQDPAATMPEITSIAPTATRAPNDLSPEIDLPQQNTPYLGDLNLPPDAELAVQRGGNIDDIARNLADVQDKRQKELEPYLSSQKKGLAYMEALQKIAAGPGNLDISPLMSLYDSQYGTKLAQNYKSPQEMVNEKLKSEEALQAQRKGLTEDEIKALSSGALTPAVLARLGIAKDRMSQQQDFMDQRIHRGVMNAIDKDKTLAQQFVNLRGLQNAATLIDKTENPTVQQLTEFQQAVLRSLNLQGSSGVDERAQRYYSGLGLDADKMVQFLLTKPVGIGKNNPFLKQVRELAHNEAQNASSQIDDQLNGLTQGYGYMYSRRPELKQALMDKANAVLKKKDLPIAKNGYLSAAPANYPQGSDTGSTSKTAASKPQQVIQNGHTYTLNPKTGKYE